MLDKIVNSDCVIDVLAAFVDWLPLDSSRRKAVWTKKVLDDDLLQQYTDEEKELAYRFLLSKGFLEIAIPVPTKPIGRNMPRIPRQSKASILQGPSSSHAIIGVSPAGYQLLELASFPEARKKLLVQNIFEGVCKLLDAGKNAAEILRFISGLL